MRAQPANLSAPPSAGCCWTRCRPKRRHGSQPFVRAIPCRAAGLPRQLRAAYWPGGRMPGGGMPGGGIMPGGTARIGMVVVVVVIRGSGGGAVSGVEW